MIYGNFLKNINDTNDKVSFTDKMFCKYGTEKENEKYKKIRNRKFFNKMIFISKDQKYWKVCNDNDYAIDEKEIDNQHQQKTDKNNMFLVGADHRQPAETDIINEENIMNTYHIKSNKNLMEDNTHNTNNQDIEKKYTSKQEGFEFTKRVELSFVAMTILFESKNESINRNKDGLLIPDDEEENKTVSILSNEATGGNPIGIESRYCCLDQFGLPRNKYNVK